MIFPSCVVFHTLENISSDVGSHVQCTHQDFLFASESCSSWSCSTDRALALFEPCRSKCVSHAKWRTDVVYGQSNIVLGCLHCTWWYGANRGICQMQSGVMEEEIERGDRERGRMGWSMCVCAWVCVCACGWLGGVGGWTAWVLPNSLWSISCGGQRAKHAHPPLHEYSSVPRGKSLHNKP